MQKLSPDQKGDRRAEVDFFLSYMEGMEQVKELGGLHVIGSTRHEARRIDQQLRGRAARQGDPGSSRFYLSMEDELLVRFGSLEAQAFLEQEELRGGDPLLPCPAEAGRRVVEAAQNRVENENFEIREHLLDYDDVINAQRLAIYKQRDRILSKPDLSDDLAEMLEAELSAQADGALQAEDGLVLAVHRLGRAPATQPVAGRRQPCIRPGHCRWSASLACPICRLRPMRPGAGGLAERWPSARLLAEQRFVQEEVERQCQAALAGWQAAVTERMDAVEAFLDSLDPGSPSRGVARALSEAAGMPIQLSEGGWRLLRDNPRAATIEVLDQVETTLLQDAAAHVSVVLERFLGQPLATGQDEQPAIDPQAAPRSSPGSRAGDFPGTPGAFAWRTG